MERGGLSYSGAERADWFYTEVTLWRGPLLQAWSKLANGS
jgi:hypothetical protein